MTTIQPTVSTIEWDGTTLVTSQIATASDTSGHHIVVERSAFTDTTGNVEHTVDMSVAGGDLLTIAPADAFKLGAAIMKAALDALAAEEVQR